MNESSNAVFHPKPIDRVSRLLGIIFIFLLAGPPIGSLVYVLLGLAAWIQGTGSFHILGALGVIGLSYVLGFLPAIVSGLIIGIAQSAIGRVPWWIIPIASYFAASVWHWRAALRTIQLPDVPLHFFVACLVATIGCTLIVRWLERVWWRPTDAH